MHEEESLPYKRKLLEFIVNHVSDTTFKISSEELYVSFENIFIVIDNNLLEEVDTTFKLISLMFVDNVSNN